MRIENKDLTEKPIIRKGEVIVETVYRVREAYGIDVDDILDRFNLESEDDLTEGIVRQYVIDQFDPLPDGDKEVTLISCAVETKNGLPID